MGLAGIARQPGRSHGDGRVGDPRRVPGTTWVQRTHTELYEHGVAIPEGAVRWINARRALAGKTLELSAAARQRITRT